MDDLNLELRQKVLVCALKLEQGITEILYYCFNLSRSRTLKAFGNQSSNISFQNKLNILRDIDVLVVNKNINEYSCFDIVMQYRNKFLHVYDCDTYAYAAFLIDEGKHKTKRKKFSSDVDYESHLENEFDSNFEKSLKIMEEKLALLETTKFQKKQNLNNLFGAFEMEKDAHKKLYEFLEQRLQKDDADTKELSMFKRNTLRVMRSHYKFDQMFIKALYDDFNEDGTFDKYHDALKNTKFIPEQDV